MEKKLIINRIIEIMLIDEDKFFNGCREIEYVDTRYIIIKYLKENKKCKYAEIGRLLGQNKSTILKNYLSYRVLDSEYNRVVSKLRNYN